MTMCPRCGVPNEPEQPYCSGCGYALASGQAQYPSTGSAPKTQFKGTMLGMAPEEPVPPTTPSYQPAAHLGVAPTAPNYPALTPAAPEGAQRFKGTMMGMAPTSAQASAPPPPPPPPAAPGQQLRGTMLGIAPAGQEQQPQYRQQQYAPAPYQHQLQHEQASAPPPQVAAPMASHPPYGATMVGAPSPDDYSAGYGQTPYTGGTSPKTLLGIAHPGIAPLHPGHDRPAPAAAAAAAMPPPAPYQQYHQAPPQPPVSAPPTSQPGSSARRVGADRIRDVDNLRLRRAGNKRAIPVGAAIAIVSGAALLAAAIIALFLYDSRGALVAQVALDGEGRERLELTCDKCTDAASVRLGSESARFKNQRAALVLDRPLAIGDNRLTLDLERSPGKVESVELTVPVEYRVRGDTSALEDKEPRLRVQIQAVPGTTVVVDGRPVALRPNGTGSADIDVSSSIRGQEHTVRRLERRIPYTITPPGSPTHGGEVAVQLGVAPLTIDAPGESIVIDTPTFVLAGRTFKGGTVTVEGRPITVDNHGKFAQMMNVSAAGETTVTVRSSAPGHAPRLVPIRIRRVESLATEVAAARDKAAASYSEVVLDPEAKRGAPVVLEGNILESRTENFATVILLEVKSSCASPPCLAKVTYGAKALVGSGDAVIAVGRVAGAVDGPREHSKIPAVAAEYVVKASK